MGLYEDDRGFYGFYVGLATSLSLSIYIYIYIYTHIYIYIYIFMKSPNT